MTVSEKIKNKEIQEIFQTMDCEFDIKLNLAKNWIEEHGRFIKSTMNGIASGSLIYLKTNGTSLISVDCINKDYSHLFSYLFTHTAEETYEKMLKLADEIEKNKNLFAQLEFMFRGISRQFTFKSVDELAECLRHYSVYFNMQTNYFQQSKSPGSVYIDDNSTLYTLGLIVAKALSAGQNIYFVTTPKYSICATLLRELSLKVGFSSDIIHILPVLNFSTIIPTISYSDNKIPVIVLNSSDVRSACEFLVSSCFNFPLMQINKVIVQEDIFDEFIERFKKTFQHKKNKNYMKNDIDLELDVKTKFLEAISNAEEQGIEVFNKPTDLEPTFFIGAEVLNNDFINKLPIVTFLRFRTANEAVLLANHTSQKYGASVWTENISLFNEIAKKLDVKNVWCNNSHLNTLDIIPFSIKMNYSVQSKAVEHSLTQHDELNEVVLNKMKKIGWMKQPKCKRINCLLKLGKELQRNNKTDLSSFINGLCLNMNSGNVYYFKNYYVTSLIEARDIILIENCSNWEQYVEIAIVALFVGSAVLIIQPHVNEEITKFLQMVRASGIPPDIIKVYPNNNLETKTFLDRKGIYRCSSYRDCFDNCYEGIINDVAKIKNIWQPVTESFL